MIAIILLTGRAYSESVENTLPANTGLNGNTILSGCEYSYPPYCMVTQNSEATGFSVDLLKAALKTFEYDVRFKIGTWDNLKNDLISGSLQVLPLVGRTPERELIFDFTFPYLTMHGAIIVREDNNDIRLLSDLKGKQVAVMKGDNAEEFLLRTNLDAQLMTTKTFKTALEDLSEGNYDAVVMQKLVALELIRQNNLQGLKITGPPLRDFVQSFCFATPKGNQKLLGILNEGLSIIIADGTFRQLRSKWFGPIEILERKKKHIIIGGDDSYPPYEFLDHNGQPAGYNIELSKAIARELGISIEIILKPWNQIRDDLLNDKVDALQGMFYSLERDQLFDFSPAHAIASHAIVVRKNTPMPEKIEDLSGKSILVQKGGIMQDIAISHGYKDRITAVESPEKILELLDKGEYDCGLMAKVPALYLIDKNSYQTLAVSRQSLVSFEYCYAVTNQNYLLLAQLSEGLTAVKASGEYRKIYSKWLGIYEDPRLALRDFLKYAAYVVIPALILLFLSVGWSRALKQKVLQRTAQLEAEIKERKQIETALMESEFSYKMLFNEMISGFALHDPITDDKNTLVNFRFLNVNPAFEKMTGLSAVNIIGKMVTDVFPEMGKMLIEKYSHVARTGEPVKFEDYHRPSNKYFEVVAFCPQKGQFATFFSDISQRMITEQETRRIQKLESLGTLAGGLAHDFNNIMMILFGNITVAKAELTRDHPGFKFLERSEMAMARAVHLTRQLMTFARGGEPVKKDTRFDDLIEEVVLFDLSGSNIKLVFKKDPDLWRVDVDKAQMQEVFSNLTMNAKQAMSEGGHLYISLENMNNTTPSDIEPADTKFVKVTVKDEGTGIPEENLDRIFDPYFTTRQTGNGLGLATVYSIIKKHGGTIRVDSVINEGTTFTILLPVPPSRVEVVPDQSGLPQRIPRPGGRILVMDDEKMICTLLENILCKAGYAVTKTHDGREAIREYQNAVNDGVPFDAVIMDLTVPGGMGGKEANRRLLEIDPAAKTIVSSGYSDDPVLSDFRRYGFSGIVEKPYTQETILKILSSVLNN